MKKTLLLLLSLLIFTACQRKETDDLQIISVDNTQISTLPLDSKVNTKILALESSTDAFFINVKNIYVINDTIIVYGTGKLSAFDKSGKYLFDYGKKGQGPEEYINLSSVFVKDENVFILDGIGRNKILKYTLSGRFIESTLIKRDESGINPSYILPIPGSDRYMAMPTFRGIPDAKTPILGLYSSDFAPMAFTAQMQQSSWTNGSFPLIPYIKGVMLYNETASYDILMVKEDLVPIVKYRVDFGKDAISKTLQDKGPTAIYEALMSQQNDVTDKCIFINFINSTEDKIIFTYQFDKKWQIASFDKGSGKTKLLTPTIPEKYKLLGFIKVIDKRVYMIAEDLDDPKANFSIVTFNLSAL